MKSLGKIAMCLAVSSLLAYGGLNPNAVISLDLDPTTSTIDSNLTVYTEGAVFAVAIRIDQIVSLKGYTVRFDIDTTELTFHQFVLSDGPNSSILGSNPMTFTDNSGTSIEVVVSSTSPVTVSSGYLGTIFFRSRIKTDQQVEIKVSYSELIDAANSLDLVSNLRGCVYRVEFLQHALTLMSGSNGTITLPSESPFAVDHASPVPIAAVAHAGFVFLRWELLPADAGTIVNSSSENTSVLLVKDATLSAIFETPTNTQRSPSVTPKMVSWRYTNGSLRLDLDSGVSGEIRVEIFDLKGIRMKTIAARKSGFYNLAGLPSGNYMLVLKQNSGTKHQLIMIP